MAKASCDSCVYNVYDDDDDCCGWSGICYPTLPQLARYDGTMPGPIYDVFSKRKVFLKYLLFCEI